MHKPGADSDLQSVHLALMPKPSGEKVSEEQKLEWKQLFDLRDSALQQLDALKKQAGMNKALDAEIVFEVDAATRAGLEPYGVDLEDLVAAGFHSFATGNGVAVKVVDRRETYKACARSWKRRPDVGQNPLHPELSARDAAAVEALQGNK
jgi:isoleucyl-tRNA synthetase